MNNTTVHFYWNGSSWILVINDQDKSDLLPNELRYENEYKKGIRLYEDNISYKNWISEHIHWLNKISTSHEIHIKIYDAIVNNTQN